ncbi:cell wall-active antibiotics response protein [Bacillus sp. FJAT-18017]|uniref:cell wall-active antibiotics response protein LiaF n=1 Tax=Bacillus sp. FJAT-18017 TaxID=1705566 RepID=UPI0006AE4BC4|nr:cell wall-active antibiotics response protein LiaF [Bacillus sp. FJAT-18017]ALC92397.1 cell wall-active antibiotics response protein [Bacillus sp. FJAT-18017]
MDRKMTGDYMGWLIIAGAIVLLLEIAFFNSGLLFAIFLSGAMIYMGRKKRHSKFWRLIFWVGIIILVTSIINMMTFKLILIALLLFVLTQFIQSKKTPKQIKPDINLPADNPEPGRPLIRTQPLLENVIFASQKTPGGVYDWNDINIQTGIGDTVIDLSYTLLPKGESVIFVRNIIGNVRILVPYELEVSVHHSVVAGSTTVFEHEEPKVFNQVLHMKTGDYDIASQKVKIFTSLVVGNLEVARI